MHTSQVIIGETYAIAGGPHDGKTIAITEKVYECRAGFAYGLDLEAKRHIGPIAASALRATPQTLQKYGFTNPKQKKRPGDVHGNTGRKHPNHHSKK